MDVREGIRNATLAKAGGFEYFSAIWSLKWEAIFSLLLPLYVAASMVMRRSAAAGFGLPLLVIALGGSSQYLLYLPVFLIGCALFTRADAARNRWASLPALAQGASVAGALVLLTSDWWLGPGNGPAHLVDAMVDAGASGIVALAICSDRFGSFLATKPVGRLGLWSFSLYLVHEPVLVSASNLLGGSPSAPLFVLLGVALAVPAAALFFLAVEKPAHNLSRLVKDRLTPAVPSDPHLSRQL